MSQMGSPLLTQEKKVGRRHLERLAVVYVRQSSVHQVQRNQESTQLQYGLVDHAARLGWPRERTVVIDDDLGVSGASSEGRLGFQRLLSEVALDHVGIILGVEMSRVARSCKDWYQLLELCALFGTLISDLDGLYDPTCYNDRLLLGLKGTMSEAELHIIRQRMWQGALQKARRGELITKGPVGYVRAGDQLVMDPDEQARSVIRLIFEQFDRLGTMHAVLRYLVDNGIRLPVRSASDPNKGQLEWRRPNQTALQVMLTHPVYAGAYVFGRSCQSKAARQQRRPYRVPRSEWLDQPKVLPPDEQERIRRLAADVPLLWHAATTTGADRKEILREVIDRVEVNVEGESEWVEAKIRWTGGHQTYTRFRRPVQRFEQLSAWRQLRRRVEELLSAHVSVPKIAEQLTTEGFRTVDGKPFSEGSVRMFMTRQRLCSLRNRPNPAVKLRKHEWLIPELARELGVGHATVYEWIREERVTARKLKDGRWVITADKAKCRELAAYQARRRRRPAHISPGATKER